MRVVRVSSRWALRMARKKKCQFGRKKTGRKGCRKGPRR